MSENIMVDVVDYTVAPLNKMRAMVTGGAQGIGATICQVLSEAGATVAVIDSKIDKAQEIAAQISNKGGRAIAIFADISDQKGCQEAVTKSVSFLGGIDILVNCAAPSRDRKDLRKMTEVDWDAHQQIVLEAPVRLIEMAEHYLRDTGFGVIVNISSITSYSIAIDQCSWPYHVSKAGLNQLTKWLAVRYGPLGVRVNAIAPGLVDRSFGQKLSDNSENYRVIKQVVPLRRAGTAEDIAQAVVFLCSKQSAYITGQILTIDGGLGLNEVFGASLKLAKPGVSKNYDS